MIQKDYRWRKITDINREYPLFELLSGEHILLDVGFTDKGKFEIAFNLDIAGKVIEFDQALALLEEGKRLAEEDFQGSQHNS